MRASFVGPQSLLWKRVLSEVEHDFYHLPGYLGLCSDHEGGKPLAFVAERGGDLLLIPLILRAIPPELGGEGRFDAISPYGYSGPLLAPGTGEEAGELLASALAELLKGLRDLGVVSAFVRFHPLFDLPWGRLREFGSVVLHGQTVSIDLSLSREEIWRQTRENHRRDLRKARGECRIVERPADFLGEFASIYEETMRRVGASEAYYFPLDYFVTLQEVLGDRLSLAVVDISGEPACMGLFIETCGIVQYHLSGTRDAFLKYHPLKAMLDHVRFWAKERGNRVFHLGGGVGGKNDSLFDFKAGFSKARHPFSTWRVVVDEDAYLKFTRRRQALSGGGSDGPEGFFPAYRRPLR